MNIKKMTVAPLSIHVDEKRKCWIHGTIMSVKGICWKCLSLALTDDATIMRVDTFKSNRGKVIDICVNHEGVNQPLDGNGKCALCELTGLGKQCSRHGIVLDADGKCHLCSILIRPKPVSLWPSRVKTPEEEEACDVDDKIHKCSRHGKYFWESKGCLPCRLENHRRQNVTRKWLCVTHGIYYEDSCHKCDVEQDPHNYDDDFTELYEPGGNVTDALEFIQAYSLTANDDDRSLLVLARVEKILKGESQKEGTNGMQ